jgi:hypothetical protein
MHDVLEGAMGHGDRDDHLQRGDIEQSDGVRDTVEIKNLSD